MYVNPMNNIFLVPHLPSAHIITFNIFLSNMNLIAVSRIVLSPIDEKKFFKNIDP